MYKPIIVYRVRLEDGTYHTTWVCPFCQYDWRHRPSILDQCPRCRAVVENHGRMSKIKYHGDTPIRGTKLEDIEASKKDDPGGA